MVSGLIQTGKLKGSNDKTKMIEFSKYLFKFALIYSMIVSLSIYLLKDIIAVVLTNDAII
jgi:Na+-driven multidrug efflux pump